MMSKRELEKWRKTCLAKDPFHSREAAETRARRMSKRHGTTTRAYACPYCAGWHLTTKPSRESADGHAKPELANHDRDRREDGK